MGALPHNTPQGMRMVRGCTGLGQSFWYLFRDPKARCALPLKITQGQEAGTALQGVMLIIWNLFRDPWARWALPHKTPRGDEDGKAEVVAPSMNVLMVIHSPLLLKVATLSQDLPALRGLATL